MSVLSKNGSESSRLALGSGCGGRAVAGHSHEAGESTCAQQTQHTTCQTTAACDVPLKCLGPRESLRPTTSLKFANLWHMLAVMLDLISLDMRLSMTQSCAESVVCTRCRGHA